jgi:hypothetical protein
MAQGAASIPHSGYTLWDHLAGVHRILHVSRSAEHVCTAGLFHSVYGTSSFKTIAVDRSRRQEVRELVGEWAEDLAWAFCNLSRPKLFEVSLAQRKFDWLTELSIRRSKQELWEDLARVECANLLEQKTLYQFPFLLRHAREIGMLDTDGFSV